MKAEIEWFDALNIAPKDEGEYLVAVCCEGECWIEIMRWESTTRRVNLENGDILFKKTRLTDWKTYNSEKVVMYWAELPDVPL